MARSRPPSPNIDKLMPPVFRFGSVARNKKDFSCSYSVWAECHGHGTSRRLKTLHLSIHKNMPSSPAGRISCFCDVIYRSGVGARMLRNSTDKIWYSIDFTGKTKGPVPPEDTMNIEKIENFIEMQEMYPEYQEFYDELKWTVSISDHHLTTPSSQPVPYIVFYAPTFFYNHHKQRRKLCTLHNFRRCIMLFACPSQFSDLTTTSNWPMDNWF